MCFFAILNCQTQCISCYWWPCVYFLHDFAHGLEDYEYDDGLKLTQCSQWGPKEPISMMMKHTVTQFSYHVYGFNMTWHAFYMISNVVFHWLIVTVGIYMTTNVGIHMTANVGICMTTNVAVTWLRTSQLYYDWSGRSYMTSNVGISECRAETTKARPKFPNVPLFWISWFPGVSAYPRFLTNLLFFA